MEASTPELKVSEIEISGANPRKDVKGETFKELKQSIAEHGILEPILVRPKGKKYELVAGERRLTAAKELKLEKVPVAIRELDDYSARVFMLLENLQREDLAPLEEAAALEELLKPNQTTVEGKPFMTQEELAKKLGKSQPWIANRLRLMKAPTELRKHLEKGKITAQHVMVLLPFTEWPVWEKALRAKIDQEIQVSDFEPFTVQLCRDAIEQLLSSDEKGENCFRPDSLPWKLQKYKPYLDLSACAKCKVPVAFKDFNGSSQDHRRVCLKIDCFRPKFKAAAKAYREAEAKRVAQLEKKGSVSMGSMSRESYEVLDYAHFPKDDCRDCPHKKLSKESVSSIEGGGNKKRELCLDRKCYHDKNHEWNEITHAYGEILVDAIVSAEKKYLASRSAGLKKAELLLLVEQFAYEGERVKKGKADKFSEKDLESELLHSAIMRKTEYGSDEDLIEGVKQLPFKVELPPMPKPEPKPKEEPLKTSEDMDPALQDAIKDQRKKAKKKGAS